MFAIVLKYQSSSLILKKVVAKQKYGISKLRISVQGGVHEDPGGAGAGG